MNNWQFKIWRSTFGIKDWTVKITYPVSNTVQYYSFSNENEAIKFVEFWQ